jgi:hypothetical protein
VSRHAQAGWGWGNLGGARYRSTQGGTSRGLHGEVATGSVQPALAGVSYLSQEGVAATMMNNAGAHSLAQVALARETMASPQATSGAVSVTSIPAGGSGRGEDMLAVSSAVHLLGCMGRGQLIRALRPFEQTH